MNLSMLGVSPQKEKQFARKGIYTAEDLMHFLPRKYNDFSQETGIMPEKELSCMTVRINRLLTAFGRVQTLKAFCTILSSGKKLLIVWFNQNYLYDRYLNAVGRNAYVAGRVTYNAQYKTYQISSPQLFEPNISSSMRVYPVYSKIAGMSNDYLTEKIKLGSSYSDLTKETLPYDLVSRLHLLSMKEALYKLHFPQTMEQVHDAQERLVFNDLLYFALQQEWATQRAKTSSPFQVTSRKLLNGLLSKLPYKLTPDQRNAVERMLNHLSQGQRINALVQGDVGCGKTIVAFLMMAAISGSGYQSVLMAPTQVLARQHFEDLKSLLPESASEVVYLGSETKSAERKKTLQKISSGEAKMIIGTHSVIAAGVEYKNLALTVTDEEHKFGVAQRKALIEKAEKGVHSITMSATPIPRTLAQVLYGNTVQLHTIQTMPSGRVPVKTGIATDRNRIYRFILNQVKAKHHQAYIVCPMIDQNEDMKGVQSVEEVSQEYRAVLEPHGVSIATLTGRHSRSITEQTISDFKAGMIDVLISTSVIEVGVNVPNATVMVISSADRFGLSSLHQLRGRVGRSTFESFCVLESSDQSEKVKDRLNAMCQTTNGFEIAQADLRIRGAGDFLGTRQSGDNKYMALMLAYPEKYRLAQQVAHDLVHNQVQCPMTAQVIRDGNMVS